MKVIDENELLNRKWFYILDGKTPVNCDFWEYANADKSKWKLKQSYPVKGVEVSTIFLGMNYDWRSVKPLCFETMIFGGEHHCFTRRYTDYDVAIEDHDEICLRIIDEQ